MKFWKKIKNRTAREKNTKWKIERSSPTSRLQKIKWDLKSWGINYRKYKHQLKYTDWQIEFKKKKPNYTLSTRNFTYIELTRRTRYTAQTLIKIKKNKLYNIKL